MNPYENALAQVVDHMLSERKCCVMNSQVRDKLAMMLRMRLRFVAESISNGANHAGRTTPCYFDVERTMRQLGVQVADLKALRTASEESQTQQPIVKFTACETRDEDFHQYPQLEINQDRLSRNGHHIPKFLPPFPSLHTYRNTMMDIYTDRNYVSQRERRAQHRISTQSALNEYYVRTRPTTSLFSEPQQGRKFMVLSLTPPKQPAYMGALMPHDEVFDENVYEFKEEPNEKAKSCMFLKPPQLESSRPANAASDEDLGFKIEKKTEKAEERAKEKMLPDKDPI